MTAFLSFLEHFRQHRLGVILDDQGPSRAALIAPTQDISATEVNRILHLSGGLTFVAISPERAAGFLLEPMTRSQLAQRGSVVSPSLSQYTSVEAREGVTTGISAHDRATTLKILGHPIPQPRALVKPGHIFPVETKAGGTLVKAAIPESAIDIVRAAGFTDAALFVDLVTPSGNLADEQTARAVATHAGLPITTLTELISYRLEREPLVTRVAESRLPTVKAGEVRAFVYRSRIHDVEHVAMVKGEIDSEVPTLVRVHAENTIGDVFGGSPHSSRHLLDIALSAIGARGAGVFLYLRRPHISDTTSKYSDDMKKATNSTIMMREYGVGAQILRDLGVSKIELLTSTPRSLIGLPSFGLTVVAHSSISDHILSEQRDV